MDLITIPVSIGYNKIFQFPGNSIQILSAQNLPSCSSSPGSSNPTGDEWPMFGGALNHTSVAKTNPVGCNKTIWTFSTCNSFVQGAPAIAGGRVYVGGSDYKCYCLNATTGALIWSYATQNSIITTPAVADQRVYVCSRDENIYCLNATTGVKIWNFTVDSSSSSPAVSDGFVYVGGYQGFYCLNALNGTLKWKKNINYCWECSPAIDNGLVYFGTDNEIECVDATTGNYVWSYVISYSFETDHAPSSPVISGGRLFVASADTRLYCLDCATGEQLWNYTTDSPLYSSPAVYGNGVFFTSHNNTVNCLNVVTGARIWSCSDLYSTWYQATPIIARTRLYIFGTRCFDLITGKKLWSFWATGNIAIAGGFVYATNCMNKTCFGKYSCFDERIAMIACLPMIWSPTAPYAVIMKQGVGLVNIEWGKPEMDGGASIMGYRIYLGTSSGAKTVAATVGNVTNCTITGLAYGQTYYCRVAAINSAGEGVASTEVSTTFPPDPVIVMLILGGCIGGVLVIGFIFSIAGKKQKK